MSTRPDPLPQLDRVDDQRGGLLFADGQPPSADALRALAYETADRRTAHWLRRWADAIERGAADPVAVSLPADPPPALAAILAAVPSSGRTAEAVERFLRARRQSDESRQHARNMLWYPLVLCGMTALIFGVVAAGVAEDVQRMYEEFELPGGNPPLLRLTVGLRETWPYWTAALGLLAVAGCALPRMGYRTVVDWLRSLLPGFGQFHWHLGLCEAARHAQTLVDLGCPLPQAVRAAGQAAPHALVQRGGRQVADDLAAGMSLHAALERRPAVPRSLAMLIEWGEAHDELPAALGLVSEWCAQRADGELARIESTVPPLAVIVSGGMALSLLGSLLAPMLRLIQTLSGGTAGPSILG